MAHLIKIDVFIERSYLKIKERFVSLVRFTVIMGRKFRDPSWCPLKIEGVRLIGVRLIQVFNAINSFRETCHERQT